MSEKEKHPDFYLNYKRYVPLEKREFAHAEHGKNGEERYKECLTSGLMGGAMGFAAGGGMALLYGGVALVSPYYRGMRVRFLTRELPMLVLKGGGAFGCFLGFGGYIRCL